MSAPTGNTYAEKWTLERTAITLHTIDRLSQDKSYIYLGSVLDAAGMYMDVWRYWRKKWAKRYEIIDHMKRIMQRFEARIFEKMAQKEIPASVGMFALRHHYGWGKEPADPHTLPDYSYVDHEPIRDQRPQPEADITPPPVKEKVQTQSPKTEGQVHPAPTMDHESMAAMRRQYNQTNRREKINSSMPYFQGEAPAGFEVIRFKGGYFLKGPLEHRLQ